MSARRPKAPAPLSASATARGTETLRYEFKVVTPVFGGGVRLNPEARHKKRIDEVTPVRAASIRGQLRFWWRATHGCTSSSIAEMRTREAALWGAASEHGRVSISVEPSSSQSLPPPFDVYKRNEKGKLVPIDQDIAYGAFPLQPDQKTAVERPGVLQTLPGTYILLVLCPPANKPEVEDAVMAWLLFGNVGGRTRRGFGSLDSSVLPAAKAFLGKLTHRQTLPGVPSLHGAELTTRRAANDAISAWTDALGRLRTFRQGRGFARNPGTKSPGRSKWPEPDMIRKLTGEASKKHENPLIDPPLVKAPRAVFGMPIITHFQQSKDAPLPKDPADTEIRPINAKRMASPVILKALKHGSQWAPACLVLVDPLRESLRVELHMKNKKPVEVPVRLAVGEANAIEPLRGRHSDVLHAFSKFFAEP